MRWSFWFKQGVVDGFNLMLTSLPSRLEEFIDFSVIELQKEGRLENPIKVLC